MGSPKFSAAGWLQFPRDASVASRVSTTSRAHHRLLRCFSGYSRNTLPSGSCEFETRSRRVSPQSWERKANISLAFIPFMLGTNQGNKLETPGTDCFHPR